MRARVPMGIVVALLLAPAAALGAGDPLRSHQWGLDVIGADSAHSVSTGAGAVVAVIDTGVQPNHPDLAGRLLPGADLIAGGTVVRDSNGHGTHVTGIVAADANNGIGIEGVAPQARVLPVRVLADDGSGSDADVARGVNWAVDHGADVINLSLGGLPISNIGQSDFSTALNRALDRGVVVVASAGNDSVPTCEQPDTGGRLLCVGAIDRRANNAYYSSYGLNVNVFAPGGSTLPGTDEDILSTYNNGGYAELAGTSQAAPHVSGVAALLVSLGLHGTAVAQRIIATEGAGGVVNARRAVAGLGPTPPAASGSPGTGGGAAAGGGAGAGGASGGAGAAPSSHPSRSARKPQRRRARHRPRHRHRHRARHRTRHRARRHV